MRTAVRSYTNCPLLLPQSCLLSRNTGLAEAPPTPIRLPFLVDLRDRIKNKTTASANQAPQTPAQDTQSSVTNSAPAERLADN